MKKIIFIILLSILTITGRSYGEGEDLIGDYVALGSMVVTIPNIIFFGKNIYQINNPEKYNHAIPINGIIFGSLQISLGVSAFAYYNGSRGKYDDFTSKGIAEFDIAFGSATIISSIWNLATNHKPKDTRTSWNIYTFPKYDKTLGMGLSYSYRF